MWDFQRFPLWFTACLASKLLSCPGFTFFAGTRLERVRKMVFLISSLATDLRRLFPHDCKPPLARENHRRGKYLGAKHRPEPLRDVGFSSAVTFTSRLQIRRFNPMTRLAGCLSGGDAAAPSVPCCVAAGRLIAVNRALSLPPSVSGCSSFPVPAGRTEALLFLFSFPFLPPQNGTRRFKWKCFLWSRTEKVSLSHVCSYSSQNQVKKVYSN